MPTLSDAQYRAIHTLDRNLVVMAGAGSGKTFVLVERFLNVLYQNYVKPIDANDWKLNSLVAITFTREASLEMRNRVRSQMLRRLNDASNRHEKDRWSELLSQMDSARIGTIDSLCADILRQNAAEADIDPSFTLLEEIDALNLRDRIVEDILQTVIQDESWTKFFNQYDVKDVRYILQSDSVLRWTLVMPSAEYPDWQTAYSERITQFVQDHKALIGEATRDNPNANADKLYPAYRALRDYLPLFCQTDALEASLDALIQLCANKPSGNAGTKQVWQGQKDAIQELYKLIEVIFNQIGNDYEIAIRRQWVELIAMVRDAYDALKKSQNAYDFGDLERKALAVLMRHPDVQARYKRKEFKHIMVDEFQDTNRGQWDIVQCLADVNIGGSVFIVGDAKQSIYGFRNADVSVFKDVQAQLHANGTGELVRLEDSYRTRPPLVDLLNETFGALLKINDPELPIAKYEVEMQPMNATRPPMDDALTQGFAPLEVIALNKNEIPDDLQLDKKSRLWEADEIAKRIQAMVGHCHVGDNPPRLATYRDVAILFRATTSIKLYEDAFDAYGIPFVTVAGRGFYNRQEVWDVLNFLRVMYNPFDDIALTAVLRSPIFGFSDNVLLALRWQVPQSLWQTLSTAQSDAYPLISASDWVNVAFAWDVLSDLHRLANRVTVAELLQMMLAKTGYLAILTGLFGGTRLRRNVEKLIEVAQASKRVTLGDFIHYTNELFNAEVREGEALQDASGAVTLMSIHASKGLEFPIVFVADVSNYGAKGARFKELVRYDVDMGFASIIRHPVTDEEYKSADYEAIKAFIANKEDTESWRLLYVASTRAKDYLILSGAYKLKDNGDLSKQGIGLWMQRLWDLYDMKSRLRDNPNTFRNLPFRATFPALDAQILMRTSGENTVNTWWDEPFTPQPAPETLALLGRIQIAKDKALEHISATQLSDIGGLTRATNPNLRDYYRQSVRMGVLEDEVARVTEAIRQQSPRVTRRVVGQIVHEALRHWQFLHNTHQLTDILKSYAWRFHLTDETDIQRAVDQAQQILANFQTSQVYADIESAKRAGKAVYPELPFIFRTEKRILHGVMDLLFQNVADEWVIVDFKTGGLTYPYAESARHHTQQYYLQIGAYAEAVKERLKGITPKVLVHYITYNITIEVYPDQWQGELRQLEQIIGNIVSDLYV